MTCIAIDDEPMALEVIRHHLEKIPIVELMAVFTDAFKALAYIHENPVDLIFLDISMPDITGMQLIRSLPQGPTVVFTTAHSKYAVESYEVNALDYLLKPISFDRLMLSVNKAYAELKTKGKPATDDFVFIRTGTETHKVKLENIQYVEANGNYVNFMLRDSKILSRISIADALKMLPERQFIRVHRSFIISFDHLNKIESYQVNIAGHTIPLGEAYREKFLQFIHRHNA